MTYRGTHHQIENWNLLCGFSDFSAVNLHFIFNAIDIAENINVTLIIERLEQWFSPQLRRIDWTPKVFEIFIWLSNWLKGSTKISAEFKIKFWQTSTYQEFGTNNRLNILPIEGQNHFKEISNTMNNVVSICQVEIAEAVSSCGRASSVWLRKQHQRLKGPIGPLKSFFFFQGLRSLFGYVKSVRRLFYYVELSSLVSEIETCLISLQLGWFSRMSKQERAASFICFKTTYLYRHHRRHCLRSMLRTSIHAIDPKWMLREWKSLWWSVWEVFDVIMNFPVCRIVVDQYFIKLHQTGVNAIKKRQR